MITLYGCPNTRSLRAVWALEEAGAQYDYVKVELMKGGGRRPEFLQLNPSGKVPLLVDDDLRLPESAAIVTYVGSRFPESGLVPQPARERALHDRWCHFVIGELEQPLWTLSKHTFALPEKRRVPAVIDTARWEFEVAARVLDEELRDSPYILGERFSGADVLIAHTLAWARASKVPIASEKLAAYAGRCLGRPAFARARAREAA